MLAVVEQPGEDFVNSSWAFATVYRSNEKLFADLARAMQRRASEFKPQDLANTAWALVKVGHLDEKLFEVFAGAVARWLSESNAQDRANTAWAFVKGEAQSSTNRTSPTRHGQFASGIACWCCVSAVAAREVAAA